MQQPHFPSAALTSEDLEPLTLVVRQSLEHGADVARELFEDWDDKKPEPLLFASIVRYKAYKFLESHQQLVGYVQDQLVNSGLSIKYAGYHLKVWKASHGVKGGTPRAGSSQRRIAFVCQYVQPVLLQADAEARTESIDLNLILLWSLDRKHRIQTLRLVLPNGVKKDYVLFEWNVALPDPILTLNASPVSQTEVTPLAEIDELDDVIGLQVEDDTSAGQSQ